MRRHLAALALLSAVMAPASANAQAVITEGEVHAISEVSSSNNFYSELVGLGYNRFSTLGTSITLLTDSAIDFYFLGSESDYQDGFLDFLEDDGNHFADPQYIFTATLPGGPVIPGSAAAFAPGGGGGTAAVLGEDGFGVFLKPGWISGVTPVERFIIGYDDQSDDNVLDDDNHDDLMVLAVVRSVPEPGTWATLLLGFGLLGAAMRRKTARTPRFRAAIA